MKNIWPFLKRYTRDCILGPLFKLLEASFELLIPLVVADIIDIGIAAGDTNYIIRRGLLMAALGFVGMLFSISAQFFCARAAVNMSKDLRHALFEKIQSLSYSRAQSIGASTLLTRVTGDVTQVQTGVNLTLRLLLRSPFIVFGAMIMSIIVHPGSGWIFAVTIPVLSGIVYIIMKATTPRYKTVRGKLDNLTGRTRQNLTGVRVIRAFNREEREEQEFREENEIYTDLQQRVGKISAMLNPITQVVLNAAAAALIHYGALRVNTGVLTQGQVVALVNYISQILVEVIKFANVIINISKALACADRIQDILDLPSGQENTFSETPCANAFLSFEHVSLTYPNAGAEALNEISFSLQRGQTLGIIGGTGSGKSSVVNLIPRFYDATEGRVCLDGQDVRARDTAELRKKIGLVPQKASLFKGSIRSNLLMADPDASEETLWEALRIAQAEDFVREKPGEIDAPVEQEGRNFSGGQRQRLTIARALVRKPELLILDDSASALDFVTDARLRRAIREADPEMSVIIVSQRTASVRFADLILVLDEGHCCGLGTHEELLESCPVYQEIYASQFKSENETQQEDAA